MKIGINGLGRIGRCILRAIFEHNYKEVNEIQLNASADIGTVLHLVKYDSVHGQFKADISINSENSASINGIPITLSNERDLKSHKWNNIDVVMECTGKFKIREQLQQHINSGAKKVILSCPAKDKSIPTFIFGVNQQNITENDSIISIGSCTTNALAPIAKLINDKFAITQGFVTTIHSYTNDQNILDTYHKDQRRARSAAISIIPTSTGAAESIHEVIPELKGKLNGSAVRVPTPNVSMIDCCFNVEQNIDEEKVNQTISKAAENLKPALTYTNEPLVSVDFTHNPYSSIIDLLETRVVNGNLLRLVSWYDNEWAFSIRMLDTASIVQSIQ